MTHLLKVAVRVFRTLLPTAIYFLAFLMLASLMPNEAKAFSYDGSLQMFSISSNVETMLMLPEGQDSTQVKVLREWTHLVETKDLLDITYSIVECSGNKVLMLNLMNENTVRQQLRFVLTVTDKKDKLKPVLEKSFDMSIDPLQNLWPQCGKAAFPDQKIVLPATAVVADLLVSVKIN